MSGVVPSPVAKNNRIEERIGAETVPTVPAGSELSDLMASGSRIAEIQEEIDRFARASLATCWLGNSNAEDEEYGL